MTKHKHYILDTNVILRYLLRDNEGMFQRANAFFEKIRTGSEKAIIPDCVLTECVYVLIKFYRIPREETAEKLKGILLYRGIANTDYGTLIDALELFRTSKIDIVDCILHRKAIDGEMLIFSFDQDITTKLPRKSGGTR